MIDNNVSSIVTIVDDLGTPCDEVDYTPDILYWVGGSLGWDRCCLSLLNDISDVLLGQNVSLVL